jgi:hypothetical protein
VNQFLELNSVTWYFSKQTYMLRQIELHKDAMDKTFYSFLMLTPADVKTELGVRHKEWNGLKNRQAAGEALAPQEIARGNQLQLEIKHLHFVRYFHNALQQMDKPDASPRLVKNLVGKLVGQLAREDAGETYKDGILQIISFVDPDNQTTVQIMVPHQKEVITMFFNVPNILRNSPERLELFLNHYPMYDKDNNPIEAPIRNRIVRAVQAA